MKSYKLILFAAAVVSAASCGRSARIDCCIAGVQKDSTVVAKLLDVNTYTVLDTLKADARGAVSVRVDVQEGQPEFVYFFCGDTKVASAVALPGDRITVRADGKGKFEAEGSEESALLAEVENDYSDFLSDMVRILSEAGDDEVGKLVSGRYVKYYRQAVKFLVSHPRSITTVPLCFQKVNDGFPVFKQATDAIQFRNVCDSLSTVYPDSRYLKALEKETTRRENMMKLNNSINAASQTGFPELTLPSITGEKVSLSSVDAKAVLVYFWTSAQAEHKLFNNDVLKPIYEEFHSKGLEIYAIDITTSKNEWAATVKNQELPWINVCDGLGTKSPSLVSFNVGAIPTAYLIVDNAIVNTEITKLDDLKKYLREQLR